MHESLLFGAVSIAAFTFEVVVFSPGVHVAVGNVFTRGMRDGFVWAMGMRIRLSEVLVIRLASQIVHVDTFASFVDVGHGCFRAPIEAAAFLDTRVVFAARLDECVSGGGCECDGVKVGIDFAQVVAIDAVIRDESFGMGRREVEFHLGKLTARLGEVDGFGFGNGGGNGGGNVGSCRCE